MNIVLRVVSPMPPPFLANWPPPDRATGRQRQDTRMALSYAVSIDDHTLSADPAARGDVDHLVVGPAVLDLIIGARVRARGVPQVHPSHRGLGACLF